MGVDQLSLMLRGTCHLHMEVEVAKRSLLQCQEDLDTSKNPHSPARSIPVLPTTSLGRVKECSVLK